MADRGDTHYSIPNLNLWFLASSILFLVTCVWMVLDDWDRPWKPYQVEFRELEIAKTAEQITDLETDAFLEAKANLEASMAAARESLEGKAEELTELETEVHRLKEMAYKKEQVAKTSKALFGWERYVTEEEILEAVTGGGDEAGDARSELRGDEKEMFDLAMESDSAKAEYLESQARLDTLRARMTEAETALSSGTKDLRQLTTKLETLAPTDGATRLANIVRDFPGLDFVDPTLEVRKVVLDNLTFELNFTKKTRIDMCASCHMAHDRAGFEDEAQPLTTHPNLDLYLTSKSPHPYKQVGCTICHRGSGEALDFVRSDHRPDDDAERVTWEEEYGWHKQHHWDYPMLTSENTEASCVQCHTTSMELIADDAPQVTEGYRTFERYGCYSCHKVEWFPTQRKPGPSLRNILAKVRPEFIDSWITNPRDFRPTTWMPQFFHLENYMTDEVVAISRYGEGRAIQGQEWNDTMVGAVGAFLRSAAPKEDLPAIPVEGDAERGREVFRLSGCLACHNMAPFGDEEPDTTDLALVRGRDNDVGPNLRGVMAKTNPEWLFSWIKDPTAWWSQTRMPDLRLPDTDIADVVAYMTDDPDGIFTDVPEGWSESFSPVDEETLDELARWYLGKSGRIEVERRLAGEVPEHPWNDKEYLTREVGAALVRHQGCFSCHEIAGMEAMMPIGAELTNWASKTVDRLDFAMSYRESLPGRPALDHHYREGWLARKLEAPRGFDHGKVKNPREKARMPWYSFSEEQISSLVTFVGGLVNDEVMRADMKPDASQMAMDFGMRVVRQKNCEGCHVIDPGLLTFKAADGTETTVACEAMPFPDEVLPPRMDSRAAFLNEVTSWEEWMGEDLGDPVFRLLEPAPGIGSPGQKFFPPLGDIVAMNAPRGGDFVRLVTDYYFNGVELYDADAEDEDDAWYSVTADPEGEGAIQDVDGQFRDYRDEQLDKVRWTFAPPVLLGEGQKLQKAWFYGFLRDPDVLRPQIRVRMPTFNWDPGEAEAVADYFALKAREEWPSRYARTMRLALGMKADDDGGREWPAVKISDTGGSATISLDDVAAGSGLSTRVVAAIEAGAKPETAASFAKLHAWGARQGFAMSSAVSDSYEVVERRAPSHRNARLPFQSLGHAVAVDAVNCFQCHFHGRRGPDQVDTPLTWGPDLELTRERLREDWVRDWLFSPALVYPGTSMPDNFAADPPQYQEQYPDSSNGEQIEAVLDWLYNLERWPAVVQ
jgi:cytochrome c2